MRLETLVLMTALAGAPALAQQEPEPPERHVPIVNGHDVQPRPDPGAPTPPDREAARLLRTPDEGPVVQPHDLYGKPLGGPPGSAPAPGPEEKR